LVSSLSLAIIQLRTLSTLQKTVQIIIVSVYGPRPLVPSIYIIVIYELIHGHPHLSEGGVVHEGGRGDHLVLLVHTHLVHLALLHLGIKY
jgi:hypothetical protein